MTLTVDNIQFPIHFYHFEQKDNPVNQTELREYIRKAIKYFRENKEEWAWYSGSGDLNIAVYRFDGDEEYEIRVSKGYYETSIPFQDIDYNPNYVDED